MDNEIKPGYKTTEFWLAISTFLVYGAYLVGTITVSTRDSLNSAISHSIESIFMMIAQVTTYVKYVNSRQAIKVSHSQAQPVITEEKITTSATKRKTKNDTKQSRSSVKNR